MVMAVLLVLVPVITWIVWNWFCRFGWCAFALVVLPFRVHAPVRCMVSGQIFESLAPQRINLWFEKVHSSRIKYVWLQYLLLVCHVAHCSDCHPSPAPSPLQSHYKFPFVIHNCTKRIVNKFIERVSRSCIFLSSSSCSGEPEHLIFSHTPYSIHVSMQKSAIAS